MRTHHDKPGVPPASSCRSFAMVASGLGLVAACSFGDDWSDWDESSATSDLDPSSHASDSETPSSGDDDDEEESEDDEDPGDDDDDDDDDDTSQDDTLTSGDDSGGDEIIDPCPGPKDPLPCVGGEVEGYPCKGVALLSHLRDADMTSAAATDVWGWSSPGEERDREFGLLATLKGLAVVEVTDACEPVYLGYLPANGSNSSHYDVKVSGDYAVVVSEKSGHGMQIMDMHQVLDITTPPATFEAVSIYKDFSNAHNVAVDPVSGLAFGVGTNTCSGGLHTVDLSDPANPRRLGCWGSAGYIHDAQCVTYHGPDRDHQGKQVCLSSNGGGKSVSVVDMSEPSTGIELSRGKYPQSGYSHQGWLTEDHRYFLHGDEFDEKSLPQTRTMVWDVQDLDDIQLIGQWDNPNATTTDHNQYTRGGLLYQGNYMSGIRIIDLTNIASAELEEIAFFDTTPNQNGKEMQGVWSVYPYFRSGVTLISERQKGMFVVYPPPWNQDGVE